MTFKPLAQTPVHSNISRKRTYHPNLTRPDPSPSPREKISQLYASVAESLQSPYTSPRLPLTVSQTTRFGEARRTPYSWRSPPKRRGRRHALVSDILDAEGKEPLSSGYASHIATPPASSSPVQAPASERLNTDHAVMYPTLGLESDMGNPNKHDEVRREDVTSWLHSLPPTPSRSAPPIQSSLDRRVTQNDKGKENITPSPSTSPSPSPRRSLIRSITKTPPISTPPPSRFIARSKSYLYQQPARRGRLSKSSQKFHIHEDVSPVNRSIIPAEHAGTDRQRESASADQCKDDLSTDDIAVAARTGEEAPKQPEICWRGGGNGEGKLSVKDKRMKREDMAQILWTLAPSPATKAVTNVTERKKGRKRQVENEDPSST